jgi:hypothetical protein
VLSLNIPAANAAIFAISLVVGYLVYRHSMNTQAGTATKGDLGMALGAAATCMVLLAFLFGLGDGKVMPPPVGTSGPTTAVSASPSPRG